MELRNSFKLLFEGIILYILLDWKAINLNIFVGFYSDTFRSQPDFLCAERGITLFVLAFEYDTSLSTLKHTNDHMIIITTNYKKSWKEIHMKKSHFKFCNLYENIFFIFWVKSFKILEHQKWLHCPVILLSIYSLCIAQNKTKQTENKQTENRTSLITSIINI